MSYETLLQFLGISMTVIPIFAAALTTTVKYLTQPMSAKLDSHIAQSTAEKEALKDTVERIEGKLDRVIDHLINRR